MWPEIIFRRRLNNSQRNMVKCISRISDLHDHVYLLLWAFYLLRQFRSDHTGKARGAPCSQRCPCPELMPPNPSRAEQRGRRIASSSSSRWQTTKKTQNNRDWSNSRVADVDPRADLVEVFGGPAVEAAVVRQQVVELLQRHLEARHVRPVRHLLPPLVLHPVSAVISQLSGGLGWVGLGGGRVSLYAAGSVGFSSSQWSRLLIDTERLGGK